MIWLLILTAVTAGVIITILWQSVVRPNRVVTRGMELLASQDFNNRLAHTGISGPDKIVDLFNTMIDTLRNERTTNMEQENLLQLLTKASPMGILTLDLDKRIAMCNPAFLKITGLDSDKMTGIKIEELPSITPPQSAALVREMLTVAPGENHIIRDGGVMTYRCYHISFMQSGFRRESFLLESLTEEVVEAERAAYEKVIRTISHEVNNTMGGVRTILQTMADTADSEDCVEMLESCDERCEQMCAFVSSYADVVRLPEPSLQSVDLNREINHIIPFLRMTIRENVALEFIPSGSPAMVKADTNMMQQALVNIVKNAHESISGEKGWIRISISEDSGHTILEIANNGDPITEEISRNLFRPFYTTKRSGRGIGLTLTSEILHRHSTQYSLRTDDEGITKFRIIF